VHVCCVLKSRVYHFAQVIADLLEESSAWREPSYELAVIEVVLVYRKPSSHGRNRDGACVCVVLGVCARALTRTAERQEVTLEEFVFVLVGVDVFVNTTAKPTDEGLSFEDALNRGAAVATGRRASRDVCHHADAVCDTGDTLILWSPFLDVARYSGRFLSDVMTLMQVVLMRARVRVDDVRVCAQYDDIGVIGGTSLLPPSDNDAPLTATTIGTVCVCVRAASDGRAVWRATGRLPVRRYSPITHCAGVAFGVNGTRLMPYCRVRIAAVVVCACV
jgi:hypothetical protein